jgi:hypothetical protein
MVSVSDSMCTLEKTPFFQQLTNTAIAVVSGCLSAWVMLACLDLEQMERTTGVLRTAYRTVKFACKNMGDKG